ncbi:hypothetical protein [Candidatus Pristimantibacillus sp. PTI5]
MQNVQEITKVEQFEAGKIMFGQAVTDGTVFIFLKPDKSEQLYGVYFDV